jgi:Ca2+-binding RTX toxin-like protein
MRTPLVVAPLLAVQLATAQTPPTCDGVAATIVGTVGDDLLLGTDGKDVIVGLEGNDVIYGFAGRDVLCGGPGRDELFGGPSSDTLHGGDQSDQLTGDAGNDYLFGDRGNDRLIGGNGRIDRLSDAHVEGDVEENERFGRALTVADFNNDGFSDLAIGVPFEDVDGVSGAGAVNVIYGSSIGVSATAA